VNTIHTKQLSTAQVGTARIKETYADGISSFSYGEVYRDYV
jgi:hypothetical protein